MRLSYPRRTGIFHEAVPPPCHGHKNMLGSIEWNCSANERHPFDKLYMNLVVRW